MDDKELYKIAKKRVYAKKGIKIHAVVYILVSLLLFIISITNHQTWWIYPIVGWGIGLAVHAFSVLSSLSMNNEIKKELENLKKNE